MRKGKRRGLCANRCGRRVPEGRQFCRVCIGTFQREWEHSGRPLGDFDKWLALKAASLVGAGPWPNP